MPAGRSVLGAIDNRSGQTGAAVTDVARLAGPSSSNLPLCAPDDAALHAADSRGPPVVVKQEPVDDLTLLAPPADASEDVLPTPSQDAALPGDAKPGLVDFLRSALDAGVTAQARERRLEQDVGRLRERLKVCKAALREKQRGEPQISCLRIALMTLGPCRLCWTERRAASSLCERRTSCVPPTILD